MYTLILALVISAFIMITYDYAIRTNQPIARKNLYWAYMPLHYVLNWTMCYAGWYAVYLTKAVDSYPAFISLEMLGLSSLSYMCIAVKIAWRYVDYETQIFVHERKCTCTCDK